MFRIFKGNVVRWKSTAVKRDQPVGGNFLCRMRNESLTWSDALSEITFLLILELFTFPFLVFIVAY